MREGAERSVENPEMTLQCSLAVQIKGRADLSGYGCDRDILAVKLVFLVLEVVHKSSPWRLYASVRDSITSPPQ
jgi:hypothetical protein